MQSKTSSPYPSFQSSLRARVAIGVALPVLLMFISLSIIHYWRENQILQQQLQLTANQLGDVMLGGLRHAMLENDWQHLTDVTSDVIKLENVQRLQIINPDGRVVVDNLEDTSHIRKVNEAGCIECHNRPAESRPRTIVLSTPTETLRISTPIDNLPECVPCHQEERNHLGVLLMDISLDNQRQLMVKHLWLGIATSGVFAILIASVVYMLVHWLVVRRVEAISQPLASYVGGDLSTRLSVVENPKDELDELSLAFNHTMDELERFSHEQEERLELRRRTIVEERERIAREMHDGIAQLMGYVNTKATAARIMLQHERYKEARDQLRQLADAAGESFWELRTAILGLRMSDSRGNGFIATMRNFIEKFGDMTEIDIDMKLPPDDVACALSPESELHLLRITQEALLNIQKHAFSESAWVHLSIVGDTLELSIGDDGTGFDPTHLASDHRPRFGLTSMRERAEFINANFHMDTKPGEGTRITIRLAMEES